MNLERAKKVEIIEREGKSIEVRLFREIGQREYNAFARFLDIDTDFEGAWHSFDPDEAKRVAVQKLFEHEKIKDML